MAKLNAALESEMLLLDHPVANIRCVHWPVARRRSVAVLEPRNEAVVVTGDND